MGPRQRASLGATTDALRRLGRERIGVYRGMFLKGLVQLPWRSAMRSVARAVPRESGLVAFGSVRNRLADNSAYLFLHMAQANDIRCVWIGGSPEVISKLRAEGLDARRRWSPGGLWAALRASIYVYSFAPADINVLLSDGAVTVNLWHGVGVKRIERDRGSPWDRMYAAGDRSLTARVFADDRRPCDWLLSTSPEMSAYFTRPFGISIDRCIEVGYPRNDHLAAGTTPPSALIDRPLYDALREKELVVGYFPTWRYDSYSALPEGAPDLDEIAQLVGEQGGVVLFKPHHQSGMPPGTSESLVLLPADADLNAYLGLCDVLVTDYSSVAADFLFLNRPIVIFAPDLDGDLAAGRFSIDPIEHQPGLLVRTTEELYALLREARSIPLAENFKFLQSFYWSSSSEHSSEALASFIRSRALGPAKSPSAARAETG